MIVWWVALAAAVGASAGVLASYQPDAGGPGPVPGVLLEGGSPALGDPGAAITIVEWGDYQCTYCYRFHQDTLGTIRELYIDTGEARLVFRDFALNGEDSALAAEASRCAADQGMYWEYHDALYENWAGERTGWVTRGALDGFAASVGLDAGVFAGCMDSGRHAGAVERAYEAGVALGIDATPSFIIYGGGEAVKIRGNQPLEAFVRAIEGARAQN